MVTKGEELEEGSTAPDFKLPSSSGKDVRLSDFRGKKVVLYFYPKDDTPGCTAEACSFRDNLPKFDKVNTVVLGISKDSPDSHQSFIRKYGLNFTLLSDVDQKVNELYGTWKEKNNYGKKYWGTERSTFVIDERGRSRRSSAGCRSTGTRSKS